MAKDKKSIIVTPKKKKTPAKETKLANGSAGSPKKSPKKLAKKTSKKIIKIKLPQKSNLKNDSGKIKKVAENGESVTEESTKTEINAIVSKYNINVNDVQNAIKGVLKFANENPKLDNKLLENSVPLFLEISAIKIPTVLQKQLLRIKLDHSLFNADSDICLIVPDVKGINTKEHETAEAHYLDILRKKGVSNVKKIMTFHEFRTEYETFELKRGLVELYDLFLVDGKISGKVVHQCGKIFYNKRKVPVPIKLQASNLNGQIEDALLKTPFYLNNKGNCSVVQFGNGNLTQKQLLENTARVIDQLSKIYPGGFENIRALSIYGGPHTTSIPIYQTLKSPNKVKVPKTKTKKPKAFKAVSGELSTSISSNVTVKPSGAVLVKKIDGTENEDAVNNNVATSKKKNTRKRKSPQVTVGVTAPKKAKKNNKLQQKKPAKEVKKIDKVQKIVKPSIKIKPLEKVTVKPQKQQKEKIVKSIKEKFAGKIQKQSVDKAVKKKKQPKEKTQEDQSATPKKQTTDIAEKKLKKDKSAAEIKQSKSKAVSEIKKNVKKDKVKKIEKVSPKNKKKGTSIIKLKIRKPFKKPIEN